MRNHLFISLGASFFFACGGGPQAHSPADVPQSETLPSGDSVESNAGSVEEASTSARGDSKDDAKKPRPAAAAHGVGESKIRPTKTEAAMKFFVLDMDKGPVEGIVISLTGPDGKTFYTQETDAVGYAEVLVSVGQDYELVYLSLGRRDVTKTLSVPDEPNLNFKLTLHFQGYTPKRAPGQTVDPGFILEGVEFDTGKSAIRPASLPQLDSVLEYLTHKKKCADTNIGSFGQCG